MVIAFKMRLPGSSMNAAPELLKRTFCIGSFFTRINRTTFAFGKKLYSTCYLVHVSNPSTHHISKKLAWSVRSSADGGGVSASSDSGSGTRLNRAIQAVRSGLSSKVKEIRKHFAMKLLFFLVGFYCATAFATVIGQTGDWDILSAALAVVIVEGVGALMYKGSVPLLNKLKKLISMFNYWKIGLCLGLFLDSFKYEMENVFGLGNIVDFDFDILPTFL